MSGLRGALARYQDIFPELSCYVDLEAAQITLISTKLDLDNSKDIYVVTVRLLFILEKIRITQCGHGGGVGRLTRFPHLYVSGGD